MGIEIVEKFRQVTFSCTSIREFVFVFLHRLVHLVVSMSASVLISMRPRTSAAFSLVDVDVNLLLVAAVIVV